jgi:hypothetical protein
MVGLASLRWILTVAFAAAGVFHLVRCVRPQAAGVRTSEILHLVMCVAMIAMVWPRGASVPAVVWIAVFTVSTGWFVTRAANASGRRMVPAFFATAAATMVWMGASMPAQAAPHHDMAMARPSGSAGYAAWISAGLGGYLVLAAGWWVIRGMRLRALPSTTAAATRPLNWAALCHGLMSAAMGLALLAMA